MAIVSGDILYKASGASGDYLGGAIHANAATNYFDDVSSAEAGTGDTEYRCIYVKNNHGTLTLQGAKIWIQTNTPSADTTVNIGLGTSAVNGTEQTVANESTAPSGVSFSATTDYAGGLSIGDIPAGQHKAIWVKRIITAGAAAYADSFTLRVQGDTNP